MDIKIGDKVCIEAEVVNIDKFSQHKYTVKLKSGEQRNISEKDIKKLTEERMENQ